MCSLSFTDCSHRTHADVTLALRRSTCFAPAFVQALCEEDTPPPSLSALPSLSELALRSMARRQDTSVLRDSRVSFENKKRFKRMMKEEVARHKYNKAVVAEQAAAMASAPENAIQGVARRPYTHWIARVLRVWAAHGAVPLHFPKQAVLQETEPFALELLHDSVMALRHVADRVAPLVALFDACGVAGVMRMLNLRQTVGSAPVGHLPPSHAQLLAAFNARHAKGDQTMDLTVGGRALSKHCRRDQTAGFWGDGNAGGALVINRKATDTVLRILDRATWCNLHVLPHDVVVFEVST